MQTSNAETVTRNGVTNGGSNGTPTQPGPSRPVPTRPTKVKTRPSGRMHRYGLLGLGLGLGQAASDEARRAQQATMHAPLRGWF